LRRKSYRAEDTESTEGTEEAEGHGRRRIVGWRARLFVGVLLDFGVVIGGEDENDKEHEDD
jgi:hypothetical protein